MNEDETRREDGFVRITDEYVKMIKKLYVAVSTSFRFYQRLYRCAIQVELPGVPIKPDIVRLFDSLSPRSLK